MNTPFKLCTALALATLLPLAQAAPMSKADHEAGQTRIGASYKADKAACDDRAGNAKDVCVEEAKAREKVASAELEAAYTGKPADHYKLFEVRAQTDYAVAKERCDDHAGNTKDVCMKEAQAAETKALADAKLSQQVGTAQKDAATDKRDADYAVAVEKCDAMAGEAKGGCVAAAKVKFGKN